MATVRKREWTNRKGEHKIAWVVDYTDQRGGRRYKQFSRKGAADAHLTTVSVEVRDGTHTADSQSITIETAADLWLKQCRRESLEPTTIDSYDQHVRLHIVPFVGNRKINQLTKPNVQAFADDLLDNERSRDMTGRVLRSLAALIGNAERLGYVAKNVARGVRLRRNNREKPRPIIPTKDELSLLIECAGDARTGDKAMMMVLIFAGLRASELRGLPWRSIDFRAQTITIEQRADRKNIIGPPKSASGRRTIPIPGVLVSELRRWRLQCPPSNLGLVFPSEAGTPQFHPNLVARFLEPIQQAAGIVKRRLADGDPMVDENGNPVFEGRYALHSLRHAAASLWIDQRTPPKRVQTWMGHHSIQVTFDIYGHLFAAIEEDRATVSAAATSLMARSKAGRRQCTNN